MLGLMALDMLRSISKNAIFCEMADETAHVSNSEQLILRIRRVNYDLIAHEEFVSLHLLPRTDAHTILAITQDSLLRTNLSPEN